MINLQLAQNIIRPITVLCIGCHSDDIEIGCGGTLLWLQQKYKECRFHWAVFSSAGVRADEALQSASLFVGANMRTPPLLKNFRDGFMPYNGAEIKDVFEAELKPLEPDLIFTQNHADAHQDHRLIGELTWNTFRNHLILEYEIPKYDGDMGRPNVFVPLDRDTCRAKVSYLMESFASQRPKSWFEESTFMALMRLRGMECNSESGYAEAFYSRKIVL